MTSAGPRSRPDAIAAAGRHAKLLDTGALKASITWNAEGSEAFVGTDEPKAAFHEFGTVHMPPRSFLGGAIQHEAAEIRAMAARITAAAIAGALGGKSELFELLHARARHGQGDAP